MGFLGEIWIVWGDMSAESVAFYVSKSSARKVAVWQFQPSQMSAPINVSSDGKVTKEILREGTGPQAQRGQKVDVHYVGTLTNGKKFDASRDRGKPFSFTIGQGVIKGWSLGVATMKVGELSRFTIAPEYAYGSQGAAGVIPPNATLIFEIELLKIN